MMQYISHLTNRFSPFSMVHTLIDHAKVCYKILRQNSLEPTNQVIVLIAMSFGTFVVSFLWSQYLNNLVLISYREDNRRMRRQKYGV